MVKLTKITSRITAIFTMSVISFFFFMTVFGKTESFSFTENRKLADIPEVSLNGLYDGTDVENLKCYITDHFAGRDDWISAKTFMQAELSEQIVNGIYVSKERLLDAEVSLRTPASANADIFSRYKENYDGTVYFVAIPSSSGVYGDLLHARGISRSDSQQITAFYEFLNKDIRKIDAYNILKMMNENYIYYRTDTKWTTYGAYCVYKTVIQKLGFLPTLYDKYSIQHITDNFRGNLYKKVLSAKVKPDIIDIFSYPDGATVLSCEKTTNDGNTVDSKLYDYDKLNSSDMYSVFLGESAPLIKIKTSIKNDKKILVIKDCYADCFIPFLIQHYSEIAIISPEDMEKGLSEYININDYSQTLFLFGVENLGNRSNLEKIIETERK